MSLALNWIGPLANRGAVTSMLAGDWFLGTYARNYYAKNLLPKQTHFMDVQQTCLYCWRFLQQLHIEDLSHVLWDCPAAQLAREDFILRLPLEIAESLASIQSSERLPHILATTDTEAWECLGTFAARVRQRRRKLRQLFQQQSERLDKTCLENARAKWRAAGRKVCRHGVFFASAPSRTCPCMAGDNADVAAWQAARFMPALDEELRAIVVRRFDVTSFTRVGCLQAESRRRGW